MRENRSVDFDFDFDELDSSLKNIGKHLNNENIIIRKLAKFLVKFGFLFIRVISKFTITSNCRLITSKEYMDFANDVYLGNKTTEDFLKYVEYKERV
ncbi:TPA: hypothetical protein I9063_002418 [Clostridium perfringens]|uniref:Uncharacterized protein n=1 Tax=Clostridium perfringens TaxID=1502 RepID=A0AAN5NB89_CLOPF|nr:hypothetical protein [Clostridium perfringens]MDM0535495.1 hypothetical protein [Clostridium perfringens]HAT4267781.1 hypothetical protein [Clostridium perfringens]HAT4299033.1 hypothetical protein [Clostridium perfringens]